MGSHHRDSTDSAGIGAVLVVVAAVLFLLTAARVQTLTGDPTHYIGLARSLLGGDGYAFNGAIHTQYPPGFPLLLLPAVGLAENDVFGAQLTVAIWGALAIAATLIYVRVRGDVPAVPIALLLLLNATFHAHATIGVRSELPYLTITLAALLVLERGTGSRGAHGMTAPKALLIGALTVAAVAVRAIGIALPAALAAMLVHLTIRMRRRRSVQDRASLLVAGVACGAGLVCFLAWRAWIARHGAEASYFALLALVDPHVPDAGAATAADVLARAAGNIVVIGSRVVDLMANLPWIKQLWISPALLLAGALLALGLRRELARENPAMAWYVLAYLGVLLLWPFDEGPRFILPLLPLLFVLMIHGGEHVVGWLRSLGPRAAGTLGASIGLAGLGGAALEAWLSGEASTQNAVVLAAWLAIAAAGALAALLRPDLRRLAPVLTRAAIAVYLLGYVALGANDIARAAHANVTLRTEMPGDVLRGAIAWIRDATGSDDRIMADQAAAIHFHTGRPTVQFPVTGDPGRLRAAVLESRPQYLLVADSPEHPYYLPTEAARLAILRSIFGERLRPVHRYDHGWIFRFEAVP